LTGVDSYASAMVFILVNIIDEISSGDTSFFNNGTCIYGLPSLLVILNGNNLLSCSTVLSLNFLPINLFASKNVLSTFNAA